MNGHSLLGRIAVAVVLGAVLMMPIGVASAKKLSQPGKVMDEHLAECAEKYAYDPNKAQELGEYDLAPQEKEIEMSVCTSPALYAVFQTTRRKVS